jgi:hypothetical protein
MESILKSKLSSAKSRIKNKNDIYLDENHELMCEYYKKYLELQKQFETTKKIIKIPYKKILNHELSNDHNIEDKIEFIEDEMKIEYYWNEYNKKFINNIYIAHEDGYDKEWIKEQNKFIISLSSRNLHTLKCHTCDGDVIANYFILNGKIDKKIDDIGDDNRKEKSIFIRTKKSKTNREFILFYYQIKDYLYEKNINLNRLELEEYIKENYNTFDWNNIVHKYIIDIGKIFKKCPRVQNEFIIYRGVIDDHHLKKSYKGLFPSSTITSCTLDSKTAVTYANMKCCVQRIRLKKGSKAILLEGISMYDDDKEIILPFNTTYNIDYPRHEIKLYKNDIICPTNNYKTMIVSDLSISYKSVDYETIPISVT